MKKYISILAIILFVGGLVFLLRDDTSDEKNIPTQSNVSMVDGKQIIEINAKGGYSPRQTVAQANLPTIIKLKTSGTYDCSSAVTIPSLGYKASLPPTGETLISLLPQKEGSTLNGLCAMGMYNFSLLFQ